MTKILLLIGRTGRGKSTLANVLTSTNSFEESNESVSKTRKIQSGEFKKHNNNDNYLVIDTPGIGDTKLKQSDVLDIIAEAVYLAKDGINQVFFVTNGRFDQYEMATYNLLRTIIFDQSVTNYTTIVRTRFEEFRNEIECQKDIMEMVEAKSKKLELEKSIANKEKETKNLVFGSEKHKAALEEIKRLKQELENILESANLAEIIESCQRRIVYVDNPSIEIVNAEEQEINRYKRKRIRSREKLLTHLEKICQNDSYVPPKLKELSAEIATYMESKIKLEQELRKLKEEVKEIKFTKDKSSKNELKRVSVTNVGGNIVERPKSGNYDLAKSQPGMFEIHSWQSDQEKFTKIEEEAKRLESKKSELEEKKKKLKKEIAKKEKIIRQRVLKHIFNNYDDIANEVGGEIFFDSIIDEDNSDWISINPEFISRKLVLEWQIQGFHYRQTQKWAQGLGEKFNPRDAAFYAWLREVKREAKHLIIQEIKKLDDNSIKELKEEYCKQLEKEAHILERYKDELEELPPVDNLQEWLDEQYSTKKIKHQVKEITIDEENSLKDVDGGELDLSDYPNLEIIIIDGHCLKSPLTKLELGQKRFLKGLYCSRNQLTNLDLSGCPILEEIHCGKNKLTKLEVNYCTKLQELVCKDNQLAELNLRNCLQLEVLRCGFNQITELDLTSLKHLEQVECNDNFLTKFDYSSLTPEKLTYLNISDNNLPEQDLSVFSNLVNLENLLIGGDNKEHFSKGIYNQFTGSLEPLKNLTKLEELWIHNTDIDSGLEYLPDSVEKICFLVEERAESKVKQLVDQLSSLNFELTDKNRGEYSRRGVSKNAQEWLDRKCPSEKRVKFKELDIGNSNLVGPLSLQSFTNLKELYCSNNKITNLDLNDCPNLTTLFCYRNLITEINFSPLNFEKLKKLSISSNNLPEQDLSVFSKFTNLNYLQIGTYYDKNIEKGIFNRFWGSLKPLKVLNKLEELDISNTEITEGLENLPKSIKAINCSNKERPESKVKKIAKQLDEDNSFTCADEGEYKKKINAQEWLDKNYSQEERNKITELDISKKYFSGELIISDWPNLEKIEIWKNPITSITLNNLPKLRSLDISECEVTNLDIANCPNIRGLFLIDNLFTDYSFLSKLNSEKLTHLSIGGNNFPRQDLTRLGKHLTSFTSLESFGIPNSNFCGSLEPLKDLTKLWSIDIHNTDIDSGLDHLPESLKQIWCDSKKEDAGCLKIQEILKDYRKEEIHEGEAYYLCDFQAWKRNAQRWLDRNYPKEQRANITELNISGKELEGELDLSDFVNLENLYCDKNQLTGLNISGCYKLKHLICNYNKLTNLNIKNCPEIVVLMCGINYLTNLDFLDHLNSDKLQGLFLIDNDFPRNDLTPFSRFVNLFILAIGNSDSKERAEKGIFNRFYGSLEPLQNMSKLEHLIIPNTDIDSGLEYLPNSVEKLFCQVHQEVSPDRRVKAIGQELRRFGEPKKDESYNGLDNLAHLLPIWKANRSLKLKIQELEQANDDSFQELIKSDKEYALAAHAIQKGYNSTTVNIMELKENLTLQGYLNWQYPTQEDKEKVKEISFNYDNKELGKTINGGELDLTEFPNLEKIYICGLYLKSKLTKLTLANKVKLASLDCSYNEFQELEITDFTNLKKLVCHNNNLVSLSLTNCPNIIELDFENNSLTDLNFLIGSVPLINLEKLNLSGNKSISSLEPLKNLKNLKSLNISKTSLSPNLEHLENLTELDCSGNDLISLDLKKAINLVKIGCSNNQLTELDLSNCLKLVELNCNNNLLTNLDLTHNKELEDLNLAGNNFSEDLSFLTHLTKLESLKLGDGSFFGLIIKNKDIRNRFVGSLEYLKNMNNLRTLDISNTDLESGLEYLPDNLKKIICAYEKSDGCAKIAKQLKKYKIKDSWRKNEYDLQAWRKDGKKLLELKDLDSDEELEKLFKEFEKLLLTKTESDSEEEHSNEQSETKIQELDIQEWLDIGLQVQDYEYIQWLKEEVKMTPEQFLSEGNDAELRELFAEYKKQQTQVEIPPK